MMEKIYCLGVTEYGGDTVLVCYSTREEAERILEMVKNEDEDYREIEIIEYPFNVKYGRIPWFVRLTRGSDEIEAYKDIYEIWKQKDVVSKTQYYLFANVFAKDRAEAIDKAMSMWKEKGWLEE